MPVKLTGRVLVTQMSVLLNKWKGFANPVDDLKELC